MQHVIVRLAVFCKSRVLKKSFYRYIYTEVLANYKFEMASQTDESEQINKDDI